jgi:ribosomal-protein-alanine N-acetyltransferase
MKAPDRLESARLMLRRPTRDDAESIFARYASDPDVTRYVGWPRHGSVEQTRGFLAFSDAEWASKPAGPYLIEHRGTRSLLGSTGFVFESADEAATGYVLARDAWGHGYATEALTTLMALCEGLGLRRVYALCHAGHTASQRVLQKCGFALDPSRSREFEFPNLTAPGPEPIVCYERRFGRL